MPDKGYDGNNKINDRKKHIVIDTLGLQLFIVVTSVNIYDSKVAEIVLKKMKGKFPRLKKFWQMVLI